MLNTVNEDLVNLKDNYHALSHATIEELAMHPPASTNATSTHTELLERERDRPIHDNSVYSVVGL